MADGQIIGELLSAPIEEVIAALGRGIAQAQAELDRSAIAVQRLIDEDPVLGESGLQATWYQMPQIQVELTTAVSLQRSGPGGVGIERPVFGLPALPLVHLQPLNVRYTNEFGYDARASSIIRLTINAVPPPRADLALATPRLSPDEVTALAVGTGVIQMEDVGGTPSPWTVEVAGRTPSREEPGVVGTEPPPPSPPGEVGVPGQVPRRDARLAVNFNGAARAWFVVQYRLVENQVQRLALVVIDDVTGQVIRVVGES